MLFRKFEVIPTSIFQVTAILRNRPKSESTQGYSPWFFRKNGSKFLLHFLIHIDVLMLCRKFEVIPTSIFQVTAILRNRPKSESTQGYSPWFFRKNGSKFLLHFLIHIDVLMLCRKFEVIPTSIFQVTAILRNRKSTQGYSPWFFRKKWLRNHPKFLLHFLIHIDVLMLCRKFELIPTSIFQVTAILRNRPKSEKYPRL